MENPWQRRIVPKIQVSSRFEAEIKEAALDLWEKNSAVKEKGTDPGNRFFQRGRNSSEFTDFAKKS